jgi:hypothetical protein
MAGRDLQADGVAVASGPLGALPRHHPAAIFLNKLRQCPLDAGIKGQTRW